MAQTVVTNGDDTTPGRVIQSSAVYQFNLNSAKEKLNNVLQLLKELNDKPEQTISWQDVSRLDFVNRSLDDILTHYNK